MPQGNGTGPPQGRGGGGRMGGPFAAGPDGECVCPKCGHKVSHVRGQPCNTLRTLDLEPLRQANNKAITC
ncbi:MAG: hypothetical protein JRE64_13685 [Deltaproteobacteria bacterium]|nr:hypothetical protein [Deltaproteobacteria bacterium]